MFHFNSVDFPIMMTMASVLFIPELIETDKRKLLTNMNGMSFFILRVLTFSTDVYAQKAVLY